MAPRHRSVRELSAQLASLSKHEVARFVRSLSYKESRALAAYIAQSDGLDDLTKQSAAMVLLGPDEAESAFAALSREQQNALLAQRSSWIENPGSSGDDIGDVLAISYRQQFDRLHPKTTPYQHCLEESAEILKQQIVANQDVGKERKDSQAMAVGLLTCWGKMRTILQCYEGLIRTCWLKLTRSRRKQILLTAWPDMPEPHRPDMAQFLKGKSSSLEEFDICSSIWPYINLEDLQRPNTLLIFLNSRGRNYPSKFVYPDLELAPMYKIRKEFIALFDKTYTMDFLGGEDSMSYGAWIKWDDEMKASESIRAGRTVHFIHGQQILNIQVTIMGFLAFCVTQVLHDKDLTQLPPAVPEPAKLSDQEEAVEKMEIIAREAPYRLPNQLDLQRMRTLISAQRSQAIDHALALREDPGYFASTAEEYREHRYELLLDQFGNTHPHASDFPLYNKAVRHMAADAHCFVFFFDEILQRIAHAQDLLSLFSADISVNKDLPNAVHKSLSELQFFLEEIMLNQVGDIISEFPASPPLHPCHYRANSHGSNLRLFDVRVLEPSAQDTSLRRLLHLKYAICDSGARDHFTIHVLMDEFERLMQADSRAKDLVSAHMAKSFSRLSIFAECLHQLHQFQPWARKIEHDIDDHKISFSNLYSKVFKH